MLKYGSGQIYKNSSCIQPIIYNPSSQLKTIYKNCRLFHSSSKSTKGHKITALIHYERLMMYYDEPSGLPKIFIMKQLYEIDACW